MSPTCLGVSWYREEDYQRIIEISDDGKWFDPVYADWLKFAERAVEKIKRSGAIPVKVYIYPETFPVWCNANGMKVDARARMAYERAHCFDEAKRQGLI
jgi:hypothetical protein